MADRRRAEKERQLVAGARRGRAAAEAAEGRFRALVDCAPDAIVIVSGEGRINLVNRQAIAMFG